MNTKTARPSSYWERANVGSMKRRPSSYWERAKTGSAKKANYWE